MEAVRLWVGILLLLIFLLPTRLGAAVVDWGAPFFVLLLPVVLFVFASIVENVRERAIRNAVGTSAI